MQRKSAAKSNGAVALSAAPSLFRLSKNLFAKGKHAKERIDDLLNLSDDSREVDRAEVEALDSVDNCLHCFSPHITEYFATMLLKL